MRPDVKQVILANMNMQLHTFFSQGQIRKQWVVMVILTNMNKKLYS